MGMACRPFLSQRHGRHGAFKQMTNKIFVVTATGFEYNDEIHRVAEGGGGEPVAAFTTREEAVADVTSRGIDFLKGWGGQNLGCFGYEMSEIFSKKPPFIEMDEDDFFEAESYSLEELIDIKKLSDEQLGELADVLEFTPFDITEIPLGATV